MPILGIMASSITGGLVTGAYESIATTTLSTATASVTFSSIPATYTHLQIRGIARTNDTDVNFDYAKLRFNSDSGSNYADHILFGDGASASSLGFASQSENWIQRLASNGIGNASIFGTFVIDILDYVNTNKYKTTRILGGVDANGSGRNYLTSGLWRNTNAISSLVITPGAGTNFLQYSSFALYGIKGA
jgi:hypothetical protein